MTVNNQTAPSGHGVFPPEADLEEIWLSPACEAMSPEGRTWAQHDVWGACHECGAKPERYVRAKP